MATNPVAVAPKPTGFELELQQYEPQLRSALPSHIPLDRFKRTFITAINTNPDLARLERRSLFTALVKCAQDGLLPDGREAALVAFGGKATYLPMVAGVIKRMRNSGDLAAISAHVVYTNDLFTFELGDEERIKHVPATGDRGKPIGAYAIAKLKSGETQREFMSFEQIEAVRKVSRASGNGPWVTWWDQMARKSVVKRLAKYLPMSADLQDLIQRDDDAERLEPEKPRSRLAAVIAEPEPESTIDTESEPAAESESPTQEAAADQGPAGTQAPPASGHDEDGVVHEPPVPTIAPPPANGTVKAWGNYREQILEKVRAAPSRTWLAEFQHANEAGLGTMTVDLPTSGKAVRDAIAARASELE